MTDDTENPSTAAGPPPSRDQIRAGVLAHFTGPDGPSTLQTETVRGHDVLVFTDRCTSLAEVVAATERFADDEFLVLGDMRLTFGDFRNRVDRVATGLAARGITHGDRVALFAANRPEWVVTCFAAAQLGAITVAMNGWWTTDEAEHALTQTTPALIVGDTRRLERISTPPVPVIDFDEPDFAALWNTTPTGNHANDVAEDDPAIILFTSGTTGRSKGAVISHRGMAGFAPSMILGATVRAVTEMTIAGVFPDAPPPPGITLGSAPLFHLSGLFGHVMIALHTGAKVVYYEGRFEPGRILALIEQEKINSFSPIGATGARLINHPDFDKFDTSSISRIGLGGAPTSPAMQAALKAAFPNADQGLGGGYGSSESTAVVTSQSNTEFVAGPERAGQPHPDVEMEIRDESGQPVGPGVEGNIWVRSAYTMLGYWNDPEATAAVIDENGWLSMGDIGTVDAEGYLTINSRAREMILRSAENIYPIEIENRLQGHDAVAEVAVIGVDHPEHGQEVKAIIVTTPDAAGAALSELDELESVLHAWCAETLSPFKVPSVWEFRTEPLPRNASGKVLKRELR